MAWKKCSLRSIWIETNSLGVLEAMAIIAFIGIVVSMYVVVLIEV